MWFLTLRFTTCRKARPGRHQGAFEQPVLFRVTIKGSELLTGTFGMDASLAALIICTATGLLVLRMAIRRRNIVAEVEGPIGQDAAGLQTTGNEKLETTA